MKKEVLIKGEELEKLIVDAGFFKKEPDKKAAAEHLGYSYNAVLNWQKNGLKDLGILLALKERAKKNKKKKIA